jgi:uncharacterized membrane protein
MSILKMLGSIDIVFGNSFFYVIVFLGWLL